jgi:hypothetical protein
MVLILMRRNMMHFWMDSMMRSNFNFSTHIMRISRGWSTRLSLSRIVLKKWRRIVKGKCHFKDSLPESTRGLAYLSQGLYSET